MTSSAKLGHKESPCDTSGWGQTTDSRKTHREWPQPGSKRKTKFLSTGELGLPTSRQLQRRGFHSAVDLRTTGETGRGFHWWEQSHRRKVERCWGSRPSGLSGTPNGPPCQRGRAPHWGETSERRAPVYQAEHIGTKERNCSDINGERNKRKQISESTEGMSTQKPYF